LLNSFLAEAKTNFIIKEILKNIKLNLPNQHVGKELRAESALVLRSNFAHQWQHVGENGGRISVAAFSENVP
jgi:hypothetical protein